MNLSSIERDSETTVFFTDESGADQRFGICRHHCAAAVIEPGMSEVSLQLLYISRLLGKCFQYFCAARVLYGVEKLPGVSLFASQPSDREYLVLDFPDVASLNADHG